MTQSKLNKYSLKLYWIDTIAGIFTEATVNVELIGITLLDCAFFLLLSTNITFKYAIYE